MFNSVLRFFHKFVSVILVTIIRVSYDKITINRQLIVHNFMIRTT